MFITFEGPEGSGKSVNARWTVDWLVAKGIPALLTREPGGTPLGEQIRSLLLHDVDTPSPIAALLLFEAARATLVRDVIQPALAANTTVVCDRFADSTLAYQGYGEGLPVGSIRALNDLATGGTHPDLTVLLDVDPMLGLQRRGGIGPLNSMDRRELEFHVRVREGFRKMALEAPERWLVLDATQPLELIRATIASHVLGLLRTHPAGASRP
jgi:dTMP kinase